MADEIVVRDEGGGTFAPHPDGSFMAVCADVIDLGEKVETYPGTPERLVRKCVIVWQTGERNEDTGKPYELTKEFTLSFNEKASLRKFLGLWRGKTYTDEEARAGAPLHKLVGVNAMLLVEHKVSAKGRTYANIMSITPPPKGVASRFAATDYVRAEFWAQRKEAYATEAAAFRARHAPPSTHRPGVAEMEPALAAAAADLPF